MRSIGSADLPHMAASVCTLRTPQPFSTWYKAKVWRQRLLSFPGAIPSSRAAPPRRHGASGAGRGLVMPTATGPITDRPPTTTTGVPSRGSFRPSIRIDGGCNAPTHLPHRRARLCFPRVQRTSAASIVIGLRGAPRESRSGQAGGGLRSSHSGLRLVYRMVRHARSERSEGAARRSGSLRSAHPSGSSALRMPFTRLSCCFR
jgi:hypothetical protein